MNVDRNPFRLSAAWLAIPFCLFSWLAPAACSYAESPATKAQLEFFETRVRPLLAEHCFACHSVDAEKLEAGLLMDSRTGLLRGGDSGPALEPGDADASLLIEAVRYESYEMPPKGKLADDEIAVLEKWVKEGAAWPDEPEPTAKEAQPIFDLERRKSEHWAWQPITPPAIPIVQDTSWPRNDIDSFILASLEKAELSPAPTADRRALIRRLAFDIVGLPPTEQQIAETLNDPAPQAIERFVDRLLDSPQFGERWGRHWLDLVRYAESRGHEFDNDAQNAFQYRDYVIRALNADVPYDQFVQEHIAGDLLESPRLNPEAGFNESILATGFWFLGEWVHSPVDIRKDETDRFDNMIDVMSKTFLGVTVACARCHDHKFDAISTADYYSLSGFLQSSDYRQVRFEALEHNRQIAARLADLDQNYRAQIDSLMAEQTESAGDSSKPSQTQAKEATSDLGSTMLVDVSRLSSDQWIQDGFLFGSRPRRAGEAWLEMASGQSTLQFVPRSAAVSDRSWDGLESISEKGVHGRGRLSSIQRSGRTLRTPTVTLEDGQVLCRVHGSGHVVACVDSHRLIAGPLHGETVAEIRPDQPWLRLNLTRYVGHRVHFEFTPKPNESIEVVCVLQGATPDQMKSIESREATEAEYAAQRRQQFDASKQADPSWRQRVEERIKRWEVERTELLNSRRTRSATAMAMLDGSSEDDRILIRGNSSNPGRVEPRHFLTAISGNEPLDHTTRSGRLELAAEINHPDNPLTSRVVVNRVWHHLMGRGIVPTTDDFGVLGQRPTHPELLDHLATFFVADGQSIKRLIRYIVLSRTYQMSSQSTPQAETLDPENRLWSYRSPKRLEGEAIRDALLSISGRLDTKMYGEPVPIYLSNFMDGRGRPGGSGPQDGAGRRSIYIAVRRNFISPFMLAFDTPVPFSTMGRRNVSNVPAQALILMNDPFVSEQATGWAKRALQTVPGETAADAARRVDWLYTSAFARPPTPRESESALAFVHQQAEALQVPLHTPDLWSDLSHALINTKEFIFLR